RDDVETAALAGEGMQHGEVRVGLHGEADQMGHTGKGAVEDVVVPPQGRQAVYVAGGANTVGNFAQRYFFGIQLTVALLEVVHASPRSCPGAPPSLCWTVH